MTGSVGLVGGVDRVGVDEVGFAEGGADEGVEAGADEGGAFWGEFGAEEGHAGGEFVDGAAFGSAEEFVAGFAAVLVEAGADEFGDAGDVLQGRVRGVLDGDDRRRLEFDPGADASGVAELADDDRGTIHAQGCSGCAAIA
ncbi:hypothetical protein [Plantibacter sp. T3]|uniref:hypothetical protein n=1 Tax=Plantibacter sp. T3 TaxID=2653161 RepID=UPI00135770CF|nr:hypothetical protein [Plantibacter sp. T3]